MDKLPDYLNIGLIGITIFIFLTLIICFLRGLLRGWVKGTYHLLFMAGLFAAAYFSLDAVTNFAKTFNVSSIMSSYTIAVNGNELTIPFTTLEDTLRNGITIVLRDGFGINADPTALFNYANCLTTSIIKFALVIVEAILIFIVGNFLAFVLWHILFKFIFGRRKLKHPVRWVSGLQSLVTAVVTMSLMIAPLSSMVNVMNDNIKIKQSATENDYISLAIKVSEAYDNSLFNRTFFSWSRPDGEETIDVKLMDFLTQSESGNLVFSLYDELGAFARLGSNAANLVLGNYFADGIAWKSILTSTTEVTGIIDAFGQTGLYQAAMPFAIKLAASLDMVVQYIGENASEDILAMNIDTQKEIDLMKDMYVLAAESGAFDVISDEHSMMPVVIFDDPYSIIFNDTFHEKLEAIARDMDQMAAFNRIVAGFLYTYASQQDPKDDDPATIQLIDILPLKEDNTIDEEKLVTYKWGEEIINVIDPLYYIHDANPQGVKKILDIAMNNFMPGGASGSSEAARKLNPWKEGDPASSDESSTTAEEGNELVDAILNLVVDGADTIVTAIVGERDANGNPVVDEKGKTTSESSPLMDSVLLTNLCKALPDYLGNILGGVIESAEPIDMTKSKATLFADTSEAGIRTAFKKEFGAVLDVVAKLVSTEEGKALAKDYKNHPGIDFDPDGQLLGINSNLVRGLQKSLRSIDKSLMLTDILPPFAQHYIGDNEMLTSIGIEHLYLDGGNVGNELADFCDIFIYCPDVITFFGTMSGNSSMDRIYATLAEPVIADQLSHAIDIIGGNELINPEEERNEPIYNMIGKFVGDSITFQLEDFQMDGFYSEYDADGNLIPGKEGETYYLIHALAKVVGSGLMDQLGSSSSTESMIRGLASIDLGGLFEDIGGSRILRKTLAEKLDEFIVDKMLDPTDLDIQGISFANLNVGANTEAIKANWKHEGESLQDIIALARTGLDFTGGFDFEGGNVSKIMDLFAKFSASGIFMKRTLNEDDSVATQYLFPTYFYNKIVNSLDQSGLKYFVDRGYRDVFASIPADEVTLATKQQYTTTFRDNCLACDKVEDWSSPDGQLAVFGRLLNSISKFGGTSALGDIGFDSATMLRELLSTLAESDIVGGLIIANAMEDVLAGVDSGDYSFDNANTDYLWELNDTTLYERSQAKTLRINEIDAICDVIETVFDPYYGLAVDDGMGGFDIDMDTMNVTTISTEHFLKPILLGALHSKTFSTPKDPDKLSVFELTIGTFVKVSGVLGEIDSLDILLSDPANESNAYYDHSITDLIRTINTEEEWEAEIERIGDILDKAKTTVFVDPVQRCIDFSPIEDPEGFYRSDVTGKNQEDLGDLLYMLNDSKLFYRAIPVHLHSAFSSINSFGPGDYGTDISYANPYYTVFEEEGGTHDMTPYEENDIEDLLSMLQKLGLSTSSIDLSDITMLNADDLTEILNTMGSNKVFNSYNQYSAPTRNIGGLKQGHTAFECLMMDFLSSDALDDYYFQVESPKDAANVSDGLYTDHKSKSMYNIMQNFHRADEGYGEDEFELLCGEEGSLRMVIASLTDPALSSIVSADGFDVRGLNYDTFLGLLKPLNDCVLTMDIVPNSIYDMVINTSEYKINIDGVNFDRSNFYFSYWWYQEGSSFGYHGTPDFSQKFYEPELEQIASIVSFLSANKSGIQALSEFKLSKVDPYLIRDLLCELEGSYCFHYAGPETFRASYASNKYLQVKPVGDAAEELAPLSVFHQLMMKLYYDSNLAKQAFDSTYDLAYSLHYESEASGSVMADSGARYKLYNNILSFEAGNLGSSHDGDWIAEIEAFSTDGIRHDEYSLENSDVGLVETFKTLMAALSDESMNLSPTQFRKLSPAEIRWLLEGINRLDIVSDALPYSARSLITMGNSSSSGLGIQRFTTNSKLYSVDTPTYEWSLPEGVFRLNDGQASQPTSIKFAYTGADDHFKVYAKIGAAWEDVTALTNAATATSDAGYVTIDTANINTDFRIEANDTAGTIDQVTVYYDTANFKQSQESFASRDLDAIYYFLCSAYRGKNEANPGSNYFDFDDDNGIQEFLDEYEDHPNQTVFDHSTYGLMNFFLNSNIYGQKFGSNGLLVSSDEVYLSGDFALYNLFNVEVDFNGNTVKVQMADNFSSDEYSNPFVYLNNMRNHYYGMAMGIEHTMLESAFLDEFIVNAGTFQAYLDGGADVLSGTSLLPGVKADAEYHATNLAAGADPTLLDKSQRDVIVEYFDDVLTQPYTNAVHGYYDATTGLTNPEFDISLDDLEVRLLLTGSTDSITEPGYIGKSILAGQVRKTYQNNIASINIANTDRQWSSPTLASKERSTMVSLGSFDTYGNATDGYFTDLGDYIEDMQTIMTLLSDVLAESATGAGTLSAAGKEQLASDLEPLDDYAGAHRDLMNAFYVGSLYNAIYLRGIFYNYSGYMQPNRQNDFIDMLAADNTLQKGTLSDPSILTNQAFSYQAVASAIRSSLY